MQVINSHEPMLPYSGTITRRIQETSDTFTIDIKLNSGSPFHFSPGQFNMLYVFGVGEVPISISGSDKNSAVVTHTTRAVGAVTRRMSMLKVGDAIGVRGPLGTPWPMDEALGRDLLIVAGGIGLAPVRSVVYAALRNRDRFRRVILVHGARSPGDVLYAEELKVWTARDDFEVHVTVDRAPPEWEGNVGLITSLIPGLSFDPSDCVVLMCGPEIMMHFAAHSFEARGVDFRRVYVSMERNMKCGIGLCGHCQFGPEIICRDGPVLRLDIVEKWLAVREL
ncbi:MAG: FAD/NAD(P)-binding protein [Rhodothermales bacterium]|nr:FAD/NAD(P)-binding protein [Rhodothermales bacterium]